MPSARPRRVRVALLALAALAVLPAVASAQRATRRRPATRRAPAIEIRGQVPTPQVVTVRPREIPEFSRQILVPNFYDRQFWPSILPGYQLVARRSLSGRIPGDSSLTGASPTGAPGGAATPPAPAPTPAQPPAPADSVHGPPGTAPAR